MTNVTENWSPVVGYEGLYEVSDLGNVKSLSRIVSRNNNSDLALKERVLSNQKHKAGYLYVSVCGILKPIKKYRRVKL